MFFFGLFREGSDFLDRDKEILALAQPHLANAPRLAIARVGDPLWPDLLQAGASLRASAS
jgi:hypothetical protein